ncbi:retrovirus-related pol polyprotein from transposon TNT 1-94 [Tanacetum coccineum]
MYMFALTVSTAEPKNIKEAMADSAWIEAMQEELHQSDRLQVWELVDKPFGKTVIKLKWLWNNKKDEHETVIRNKARLVAKGYAQEEAKYALEILKKHGMDKGESVGTPMATKPKLDADLSGKLVDQTDYHSKIGSLMYLTSSRPDIVQAVCYCARYQARPIEKHLKEDYTTMSSAKAEYVALSASYAQVMWMRTQLKDYGFNYNKISLYYDSQSAIAISGNRVTEYQLADMFTKVLPEDRFQYLVTRNGMRCLTLAELEVLANESA